jgi:CTP synthase
MIIEVARSLVGLPSANSREFDSATPDPVVDLMDDQNDVVDKGGTMRLGSYQAQLVAGSQVAKAYGTDVVSERHRHRYEVNPRYRSRLEEAGLRCSGTSPDGRLIEFIELPGHPFWVGTQAHPEFQSRPDRPHPLFRELVGAAVARAEGRAPRLLDVDDLAVSQA